MARLAGVAFFFTQDSVKSEKEYLLSERQAKKLSDEGLELRKCRIKATRRIRAKFEKNIIRRGPESINWKGEKLLNLPELRIIVGVLKLNERESQLLEEVSKTVKEAYVDIFTSSSMWVPITVLVLIQPMSTASKAR